MGRVLQLRREKNGGSQANKVGLSSGWKLWQEVSLEIRGAVCDPTRRGHPDSEEGFAVIGWVERDCVMGTLPWTLSIGPDSPLPFAIPCFVLCGVLRTSSWFFVCLEIVTWNLTFFFFHISLLFPLSSNTVRNCVFIVRLFSKIFLQTKGIARYWYAFL